MVGEERVCCVVLSVKRGCTVSAADRCLFLRSIQAPPNHFCPRCARPLRVSGDHHMMGDASIEFDFDWVSRDQVSVGEGSWRDCTVSCFVLGVMETYTTLVYWHAW